ncbi:asparagine synthase-related protein [Sphingomonas sp. CJ20]
MLSLPPHLFLADGQARQPFRRAMRGILPERVWLARHKIGLFDHRFRLYALGGTDAPIEEACDKLSYRHCSALEVATASAAPRAVFSVGADLRRQPTVSDDKMTRRR